MGSFGRRARIKASIVFGFFVIGNACAVKKDASRPSIPAPAADSNGEWQKAQGDLIRLEPAVEGDPYEVTIRAFRVEAEREPFYCGDTGLHAVLLVYGCFRAEPEAESMGVIRYVPGKGALRHEARHAILFALGDSRWADVGH